MARPMNVLFIMWSASGGGAARSVIEILAGLDRSRVRPVLGRMARYDSERYESLIPSDVHTVDLSGHVGRLRAWSLARRLRSVVEDEGIDVILSNSTLPNMSVLRAVNLGRLRIPVIITERTNVLRSMGQIANPVVRAFETNDLRRLYRRSTHVIAISSGLRDQLVRDVGLSSERVSVIPNAFDLALYSRAAEGVRRSKVKPPLPTVVSAGRFVPEKGFDDLLTAFGLVQRSTPCRLRLLGDGPLRGALRDQAERLAVLSQVEFCGWVDEPWEHIADADVFVLASWWEGFGRVLIEAMACGTPVISTACDFGPPEIIRDNHTGLLVPVGDSEALAEAIVRVLRDAKLRTALAEAGRNRAAEFGRRSVAAKYEALIAATVDSHARRSRRSPDEEL